MNQVKINWAFVISQLHIYCKAWLLALDSVIFGLISLIHHGANIFDGEIEQRNNSQVIHKKPHIFRWKTLRIHINSAILTRWYVIVEATNLHWTHFSASWNRKSWQKCLLATTNGLEYIHASLLFINWFVVNFHLTKPFIHQRHNFRICNFHSYDEYGDVSEAQLCKRLPVSYPLQKWQTF